MIDRISLRILNAFLSIVLFCASLRRIIIFWKKYAHPNPYCQICGPIEGCKLNRILQYLTEETSKIVDFPGQLSGILNNLWFRNCIQNAICLNNFIHWTFYILNFWYYKYYFESDDPQRQRDMNLTNGRLSMHYLKQDGSIY